MTEREKQSGPGATAAPGKPGTNGPTARATPPLLEYLRTNGYLLAALGLAVAVIVWQAGNDAQLEHTLQASWERWAAANCKGYGVQPYAVPTSQAENLSMNISWSFNITTGTT